MHWLVKFRISAPVVIALVAATALACGGPAAPAAQSNQTGWTSTTGTAQRIAAARASSQPSAMPAQPQSAPESGDADNPNDGAYLLTYQDLVGYQRYGVNSFVDADESLLSTFALDGDTASYEILKQHLRDGYLVEPNTVRVEEYVNSLPQGFPATNSPTTNLGLHLDAGPAPFGDEGYQLLRVGVSNPAPTDGRDPVSLVFVVDVSGSMGATNRLDLAKEVIYGISEQMIPGDRVAIVTYGDEARVVRAFTNDDNARDIAYAARELRAGGNSSVEAGLTVGYELAAEEMQRDHQARVVLLSHSMAEAAETGPDSILNLVDEYAQGDVTLTTVGVSLTGNYNDVLMEVLANRGNGTYHYLANRDAAARFLEEGAVGIFTEAARDARIQVEFNPEVVRDYRLIGYENQAVADRDARYDTLDFGEIGFARDVSALYEIHLVDDAPADATLAEARLRWLEPQTRKPTELTATIAADNISGDLSATDPYFRQAAAAAEFGELLRESSWAQCGDLDAVLELLDGLEGELGENRSYQELRELVADASGYFEPTCLQ